MTAMFEPVTAGIEVTLINKHILKRFDPFVFRYKHCCAEEEDDCVSSSSTSVVSDACHAHRL